MNNNTTPLPTSTNDIFGPFSVQELKRAFETFDLDKNGYVSAYELRHLYAQLGEDVTDEEIEEMLRMCDVDGDGQVNPQEFQRMIFRYAGRIEDADFQGVSIKSPIAVKSPIAIRTPVVGLQNPPDTENSDTPNHNYPAFSKASLDNNVKQTDSNETKEESLQSRSGSNSSDSSNSTPSRHDLHTESEGDRD